MKRIISIIAVVAALTSFVAVGALAQEAEDDARPGGFITQVLDSLVESGVISQEQADAVADAIQEAAAELPPRGPRKHLATAAEFLGMEVDDLAAQLQDGQTLADIAGDQVDGLIDALVADKAEKLADAVEEGRITQEEADEKLAQITENITAAVNGEGDFRGFGRGFRRGFRHGVQFGAGLGDQAEGTDLST